MSPETFHLLNEHTPRPDIEKQSHARPPLSSPPPKPHHQLSAHKKTRLVQRVKNLEARAGIEPAVELLQSSALPLGYRALVKGKADVAWIPEVAQVLKSSDFRAFVARPFHPVAPRSP